jgi:RimJ/RimL family protein N-acetyltransferase
LPREPQAEVPAHDLRVRPLAPADLPAIVRYWTTAEAADLERMGVDTAKLPTAEALTAALMALCAPAVEHRTAYSVWLVGGEPIGYSSLKNIDRGERADIHLHVWNAGFRGRGFGARLFARSALYFYDRFALRRIVCEPSAANPMPNRMLQKAGYPLLGTRLGASSELSRVCLLNIYDIRREIAAQSADTTVSAAPP